MKFKYMIRGLGLGIIITAAVLGAYNRNAVADARVAVLKDYGLDGESPLDEETETTTEEELSAAETTEPVIMRDEEKESEIQSVIDAAKDAEQGDPQTSPPDAEDLDGQASDGQVPDAEASDGQASDAEPSGQEVPDQDSSAVVVVPSGEEADSGEKIGRAHV